MLENRDIVFLSGIGWDFAWQRHQQLATLFARRNRVLFVEMALSPANLLTEWGATLAHWSSWRRGVRGVGNNLFVYSCPPVLPFGRHFLGLNRLNQRLILRGVKGAMDKLGMAEPIVWVSDQFFSLFCRDFGQKLTVFDLIHEYRQRRPTRKGMVYGALTREAISGAQVIVTPSRLVYERYGGDDPRFFLVPNGVDLELYAANEKEPAPVPELSSLRRPLIGFVGTVGPAVDLGLVEFMAGRRGDWSFVFVGSVRRDVSALRKYPNVYFLGAKNRAELPRYISSFSAGIIPYIVSEATETVHPVKTYEYLAAGLPVVATNLPELSHLEGAIDLASTPEDFLRRLEGALEEDSPARRERRRELAREHSWEGRMQVVEEAIDSFRAG